MDKEKMKKSSEMKKLDRLNIYLPAGTLKRIEQLGYTKSKFAKMLILDELDRLEKEQQENQ